MASRTPTTPLASAWWDLDAATGAMTWAGLDHVLGARHDALAHVSDWRRLIHPEDRARIETICDDVLRGSADRWDVRYRVQRSDDSWTAVRDRATVVRDDRGPARVVGVVDLVDDPEHAARVVPPFDASAAGARHFETFVDWLPQLAWSMTPDGWIDYYNRRWYEYTGTTPADMEGWGWVRVHDPDDLPRVLRIFRSALLTGRPWEDEFRLRRGSDGALRWHLSRAMPLRDEHGRIVRWFGTNTDIEDQRLAYAESARRLAREQRARRDAEAANRAKDAFLATLSHELRTPLSAILSWTQVLQATSDERKRATALASIERSARTQTRLMEDLLDVSRIVVGKLAIESEPVALGAVARAAVAAVHPAADERGVTVELTDEAGDAIVLGSAARLEQIFVNLLHNAVKFSDAGQTVRFRLSADGLYLRCEVRDEGCGIDPAFMPQLFARFRQADTSTTRRHGGLGLGLSIAQGLVDLHGGTITAASDGPGRGATFVVALPRGGSGAARVPALAEPSERATTSLASVRLLVVDDDVAGRNALAELLLRCGATVTLAGSVGEALDRLRFERPDVIVTDIAMPGEDGFALLGRVRAHADPDVARTPVVAVTAYASVDDRRRALALGIDEYLPKPVDVAHLSRVVSTLARRRILPPPDVASTSGVGR